MDIRLPTINTALLKTYLRWTTVTKGVTNPTLKPILLHLQGQDAQFLWASGRQRVIIRSGWQSVKEVETQTLKKDGIKEKGTI